MRARLLFVALIALTWVVLRANWPIDAIHFDSNRDLLIARDCYDLGRCDGHGPPTSFAGLFQGVLWNNALGLFRWLGASPKAIGIGIAGLYALVIAASARCSTSATNAFRSGSVRCWSRSSIALERTRCCGLR